MSSPIVTVLMPIYNGEKYLSQAIDSILRQTLSDFELLIIDDGSSDHSAEIIKTYADSRITSVISVHHGGITASLNKGLALAKGKYIARMDADDISLPNRLLSQVNFLEQTSNIDICGTNIKTIGTIIPFTSHYPTDPEEIRCTLLFESALAHPTVMLKKSFMIKNNLYYDEKYTHSQDYDLWVRSANLGNLANLPQTLLYYRIHSHQVTKNHTTAQQTFALQIKRKQIEALGIYPNDQEIILHQTISTLQPHPSIDMLQQAEAWLLKLQQANNRKKIYLKGVFDKILQKYWWQTCKASSKLGLSVLRINKQSKLYGKTPLMQIGIFFIKTMNAKAQ